MLRHLEHRYIEWSLPLCFACCETLLIMPRRHVLPVGLVRTFSVGTQKFNNHFRRRRLPFVPVIMATPSGNCFQHGGQIAGNHFLYHAAQQRPGRQLLTFRAAVQPGNRFPNNVPAICAKF